MNMKADDVIMVGDNYNTDIKAGNSFGYRYIIGIYGSLY